jgi:hypothetical protein
MTALAEVWTEADIPFLGMDGQPLEDEEAGDEVHIFNGDRSPQAADWEYWDGGSAWIGPRFEAIYYDDFRGGDCQIWYYVHFDEEAGTMQWVNHVGSQFADAASTVTGYVVHEWTYDPASGEVASQGLGADAAFYPDGASGTYDGTTLTMPDDDGEMREFTAYKKPTTRAVRMPKKKKLFGCC